MPELLEIEDWAAVNDISDPVEKWTGFSNYVKEEFAKEDLSSEELRETFNGINQAAMQGALNEGVPEEEINNYFNPTSIPFEDKLKMVDRAYAGLRDPDDRQAIVDYNAALKTVEALERGGDTVSEDYLKQVEKLREDAEHVASVNYDDAVQWSLVNTDLPFARVELSDGTIQVVGGDGAIGLSAGEAYRRSRAAGTVAPNDLDAIINLTQKDKNGYEVFKLQNYSDAISFLDEAVEDHDLLKENIGLLQTSFADKGTIKDSDLDVLVTTLRSLDPSAADFSREDLKAALEFKVGATAMTYGLVKFDEDSPANNIRKFGYGSEVMHRELLEDPKQFEETIKDLDEDQKASYRTQRDLVRESLFGEFSDSLRRSYLGDEWATFYANRKGTASNADILDEFVKNTDYSWKNTAQHLGLAVAEGFTDLVWSIGAAFDNSASRVDLLENYRDRQARATVARLFGQDFGMATEVTAVAAPIIADIVATAGITAATGGIGAASMATAVGIKNTIKAGSREIAKEAVEASLKNVAKGTVKDVAPSTFLKTYSNIITNKGVKLTAVSTSAGLRSGGMTYAAVYDALLADNSENGLTMEEIHDKSLAAAGTAFALTGTIVASFGIGKYGGFESFIANGATLGQVKRVMETLSRRKLTEEGYEQALKTVLAKGPKQFVDSIGKKVIRAGVAESIEEGMDEYLNTIVQATYTNQNLSFLDVTHAAGLGMLYGGIIGGSMPLIGAGYRNTMGRFERSGLNELYGRREAYRAIVSRATDTYNKAEQLKRTNSPTTQREFLKQMGQYEEVLAQSPTQDTEAETTQPEATQPEATQPEATQPEATQSKGTPLSQLNILPTVKSSQETGIPELDALFGDLINQEDNSDELKEKFDEWVESNDTVDSDEIEDKFLEVELDTDFLYPNGLRDGRRAFLQISPSGKAQIRVIRGDGILGRDPLKVTSGDLFLGRIKAKGKLEALTGEQFVERQTQRAEVSNKAKAELESKSTGVEALTDPNEETTPEEQVQQAVEAEVEKQSETAAGTVEVEGEKVTVEEVKEYQQEFDLTDEQTQQEVEDSAEETETGESSKLDEEPRTLEAKTENEEEAEARLEELLQTGYPINVGKSSGLYGIPKGTKKFLESREQSFNNALTEQQNNKKSDYYILRSKEEVAKAYGYKADEIEETSLGFKHTEGGYLFTNDPVNMGKLLGKNKTIKVGKGVKINKQLFVVENGILTDINKPVRNPNSTKAKKAKSETIKATVAKRTIFDNAINPTDASLNFKEAGLYNETDKNPEYILDGDLTHKEAANKVNAWIEKNMARINKLFLIRKFSRIDQTDLTNDQKTELFSDVVHEVMIDLRHTVSVAALRQTVGDLVAEGDAAKLADALVESGLFDLAKIEETLSGLDKVMFETGTTEDSNLLGKSTTPKQKLATFLYYTQTGIKGVANPYRGKDFRASVDGTAKKKSLKKGWEDQIIFRSVESLLARKEFVAEEDKPFPNLPKLSGRVGSRFRQRLASSQKKFNTTQINETVVPEPTADPVDINRYQSLLLETQAIVNERVFEDIDLTQLVGNDKTTILSILAIAKEAGIKQALFTEANIGKGFANLLDAIAKKKINGEAVPSAKFQEVYDSLPIDVRNALIAFGLDPAKGKVKENRQQLLVQEGVLETLRESLQAPNLATHKQTKLVRQVNTETIERLGLVDGDSESVITALEEIARTGVDESHRLVAELLLMDKALIRNTAFRIVDNPNAAAAGSYQIFTNGARVSINMAAMYGSGIESVLLHEYLHAATFKLIRSNNLTAKQKAALARLEGLRQMVADKYKQSGIKSHVVENGILNIDELIGTMFTSDTFQNQVRGLDGLFQRIINAVKSLFGIEPTSRLSKAFDDLVDFLNMDVSPRTTDIDTIARRAPFSESEAILFNDLESLRKRVDIARNKRYSSIEGIEYDGVLTEEQQDAMDEIIDEVIAETVPSDVPVVEFDETQTEELFQNRPNALFVVQIMEVNGQEVATVTINRKNTQRAVFGLVNEVVDDVHAKMILESVLNEEMIHVAELRVIPLEDIDAVADGMSQADFDDIIDVYAEATATRNALKVGIANGDISIRRQLVGEKLRMEVQRINRGYTTEQDKAFYIANPKFYQVMFRYLKGFFKKMYAKYNLRKNNPEMSRMINQMSHEVQLLNSGVFHIRERMGFDISTPDLGLEYLNQRFNATLEDDKLKEITEDTTDEEIYQRFPFLRGFELPVGVFKDGGYQQNTYLLKFLNGELDPRILELRRQADALQTAIDGRAERMMKEAMELIQQNPEATNELLGDFLGRPDSVEVSYEFRATRYKVAQERMAREKIEKGRPLSESEREAISNEEVDKAIAAEETKLRNIAEAKRDSAKKKLLQIDPKLYESLTEIRLLLDALSKKFSDEFDTQGELKAVIDANLGIYIVRSYRAFLEEGYMDKLIDIVNGKARAGDEQLVDHYNQVYTLFEDEYHNSFARREVSRERANEVPQEDRTSKTELLKASKQNLIEQRRKGVDPVRNAILEYLYTLDPNSRFKSKSGTLAQGVTKSLVDRIRSRKMIPDVFRKFLGQYDDADVMDNVLRSISMVSQAASKESFIQNVIKLGLNKDSRFAYTLEETQTLLAENPQLELVNFRTGGRATVDVEPQQLSDEVEQKYSKVKDYYIPREMFNDIQRQFQRSIEGDLASHQQAVEKSFRFLKYAVGTSLAAKTLFSVGFYLRNILGNIGFFAPLVGLNPLKVVARLNKIGQTYRASLEGLDEYTAKLAMLNVIHGDLTSNTVKELLKGKTSLQNIEQEAEELTKKIDVMLKAGKNVYDKAVQPLMKRLVAASQAVDSFYKIAYFDNELEVLKKARAEDISKGVAHGKGYNVSDYDLEVKAAHKVRKTSQSYVDAYETVKYATGKYSFLLPPFIRFRMDILRIMFDGLPRLIKEEVTSDNNVIKARGIKRLSGATIAIAGISMVLPLLSRILAGIGDEEEEMLRETLPDWQKNATLFFWDEGEFYDLTYVNPVSGITNMAYQGFGEVLDGRPVAGVLKTFSMFFKEYGGSQIFTTAFRDAIANRDPRTGDKIYEDEYSFDSFMKGSTYFFRQAYEPRAMLAARNIGSALMGDDPLDESKSVGGLIMRELKPAKAYSIEWDRVFQRAVSKNKDQRSRMRSSINSLKTRSSMTDGDIEDAVNTFYEGQKESARSLAKYIQSARNMGVSERQIQSTISYYKLSKDYVRDVKRSVFRRPDLPKSTVQDLRSRGDESSAGRLIKSRDILNSKPRLSPLEEE